VRPLATKGITCVKAGVEFGNVASIALIKKMKFSYFVCSKKVIVEILTVNIKLFFQKLNIYL